MSELETPHLAALKKQWLLKAKAKKRVRIVNGKTEVYEGSAPAQDLDAVLAAARHAEERTGFAIGQLVDGRGVYVGTWEPCDENGKSLGRIFNVFAAREDLPREMRYDETVKEVAALKNWQGFDGEDYADDKELRRALADGSYRGGWVVPPFALLKGWTVAGKQTQPDNLFAHHDKGALKGTFQTALSGEKTSWYWSSTEAPGFPGFMLDMRFYDGFDSQSPWSTIGYTLNCRPIRLEPKP